MDMHWNIENVQVHLPSLRLSDSDECDSLFDETNPVFYQRQWGDFHPAKSDFHDFSFL